MSVAGGPEQRTASAAASPVPATGGGDVLAEFAELERRMTAFKQLYAQCQSMQLELQQKQVDLAARDTALQARGESLEKAEAALGAKFESLKAETQQTGELKARLEKEFAEKNELLEQRHAELDQSAVEAAKLQEELAAKHRHAETLEAELGARAKRLEEQQTQLQSTAADLERARADLGVQQKEAVALRAELDAQRQALSADREALEALERELAEGQARLQSLSASLEAREKGAEGTRTANAAEEDLASEWLLGVIHEYESLWLLELQETRKLRQEAAGQQSQDEVEAVINGLKDRLKAEIQQRHAAEAAAKAAKEEAAKLAKSAGKAAPPGSASGKAIASLERRRRRLKVYRELVRRQALKVRKASEAIRKRAEHVDQVLAQRADLATARNRVIEAEKRAMRGKAASRAAVVVLSAVGIVGLLGAMSWAVAREIAPAVFEATSIVKAEGRDRELSADELTEWQRFHEELLADRRFHQAAADRFKRQGVEQLGTPEAVSELIQSRVSAESLTNGTLTLRLNGKGADATAKTLETFTAAFMAYANSGNGKRIDGGVTVAAQAALVGGEPIDSSRTRYALIMMAAGVAVCGTGATLLWRRLSGAKTAFEQDTQVSAVLEDKAWQSLER